MLFKTWKWKTSRKVVTGMEGWCCTYVPTEKDDKEKQSQNTQ